MNQENSWKTVPGDVDILRKLAARKAEIAWDPLNDERRRLWLKLDRCEAERPMVLAESWAAFEDMPEFAGECQEEWAREVERGLRFEIFQFENVGDDHVVEPWMTCNWMVQCSDYGVSAKHVYADKVSGNVASRRWEPPLKDLDHDIDKLRFREFHVDRDRSLAWKAHLEDVFEGILPVRVRGGFWWTTGMTSTAVELMGLEEFMTCMCVNPDGVHRLMAFLRDDQLAFAQWLEREGLLSLNNENDYIGSGSMGYTSALPQQDWYEGDPVRLKDLWVLSESQETVSVSPEMFQEFVFKYQLPVVERFGRLYYGCCEPVHLRWHVLKYFPNLMRVSISPWCDQEFMAQALGKDYVFSRKPNPSFVSTDDFNEDIIRDDLRHTLHVARDCSVELILKDVHTLAGHPERMRRWVEIAREVIDECLDA